MKGYLVILLHLIAFAVIISIHFEQLEHFRRKLSTTVQVNSVPCVEKGGGSFSFPCAKFIPESYSSTSRHSISHLPHLFFLAICSFTQNARVFPFTVSVSGPFLIYIRSALVFAFYTGYM